MTSPVNSRISSPKRPLSSDSQTPIQPRPPGIGEEKSSIRSSKKEQSLFKAVFEILSIIASFILIKIVFNLMKVWRYFTDSRLDIYKFEVKKHLNQKLSEENLVKVSSKEDLYHLVVIVKIGEVEKEIFARVSYNDLERVKLNISQQIDKISCERIEKNSPKDLKVFIFNSKKNRCLSLNNTNESRTIDEFTREMKQNLVKLQAKLFLAKHLSEHLPVIHIIILLNNEVILNLLNTDTPEDMRVIQEEIYKNNLKERIEAEDNLSDYSLHICTIKAPGKKPAAFQLYSDLEEPTKTENRDSERLISHLRLFSKPYFPPENLNELIRYFRS